MGVLDAPRTRFEAEGITEGWDSPDIEARTAVARGVGVVSDARWGS